MNNIIQTTNDDLIGYYNELMDYFNVIMVDIVSSRDEEKASELAELLQELKKYNKSFKLLRVSNNNGMGQTVKELDIE